MSIIPQRIIVVVHLVRLQSEHIAYQRPFEKRNRRIDDGAYHINTLVGVGITSHYHLPTIVREVGLYDIGMILFCHLQLAAIVGFLIHHHSVMCYGLLRIGVILLGVMPAMLRLNIQES